MVSNYKMKPKKNEVSSPIILLYIIINKHKFILLTCNLLYRETKEF